MATEYTIEIRERHWKSGRKSQHAHLLRNGELVMWYPDVAFYGYGRDDISKIHRLITQLLIGMRGPERRLAVEACITELEVRHA